MQIPATAHDEPQRITALHQLDVLDTAPEERFDRLTRVARRLFDAPIALVSLVDTDRQWFKSRVGLDATETSRDVSFCGHAILQDDIFVVQDTLLDERFRDNPLVAGDPNIRFYAGCPLSLTNGFKLGTLCIIDRVPRQFTDEDHMLLQDLALLAENELTGIQEALTDPLTGISNGAGFKMLGAHTLKVCNRVGRQVSLLCFDLASVDPEANRLFGVPDDAAVGAFTELLVDTFNDSDVIGRLGNEQFAVIASQARDMEFESAVTQLRRAVEDFNAAHTPSGPLLAYDVGSAIGDPSYEIDFDRLFSAAALAMRPQIVCSNAS